VTQWRIRSAGGLFRDVVEASGRLLGNNEMLAKIPQKYFEQLTVRELEDLLERKRKNPQLADLLKERERLRLELRRLEDSIEAHDRPDRPPQNGGHGHDSDSDRVFPAPDSVAEREGPKPSFLAGKRKRNLKDYIAQVLLEAGGAMSPSDIQRRLPEVGYCSNSSNPRSFYNTVFQALQRYDIFEKDNKKYQLTGEALKENGVKEILPKNKTRLKDFIIEVLDKADAPLKVSEISSRVVITGYETDLNMDELSQRVSATLKKYLNKDFDWDSQRYKLATRCN